MKKTDTGVYYNNGGGARTAAAYGFMGKRAYISGFLARAFFPGVLLCCASLSLAASPGTTSANFLKIPVAAVPTGLGEAYTAMVGPDSILYNPAGLGLLSYNSFSGTHNQYFRGVTQEYAAASYRAPFGTIGLGFSSLSSGKIDAYDKNDMPVGRTSTSHQLWLLSYSQSWPHFNDDIGMLDPMLISPSWTNVYPVKRYRPKAFRLALGVSVRRISETLDRYSAETYACDFGALLVLPHHFHLGVSALNLGGKQKFVRESYSLPGELRFGLAKDLHSRNNTMVFTLASDLIKYSDNSIFSATGLEADILKMFQVRIGYKTQKDSGSHLSGGIGMNFDRLSDKTSFIHGARLDYSYMDYGALGATSRIGVQFIW
ncbi:MAG TPA: hypothetical protein DCL44_04095 [Elusimicrobia bacterium]|nr:hypothetical protein [Elusimicrobiota bacterium]